MSNRTAILFDISKNELFQVSDNFKTFQRKLMAFFKVEVCDDKLTKEKLNRVDGVILAAPQNRFFDDEIKLLWEYVDNGGKLWVMSAEGGDRKMSTNCNEILEKYGTLLNNDNVVRSHYYKNFHPKEATVAGGVVCESMWRHLITQNIDKIDYDFTDEKHQILFQYPYGSTLKVSDPSVILLTTGPAVYPFNRPIC
uniref:IFT52 GIFT domain-containing protein n=1 Tax=Megaselia scalaris TaxID=36166 RepID=T1GBI4_MEGSC